MLWDTGKCVESMLLREDAEGGIQTEMRGSRLMGNRGIALSPRRGFGSMKRKARYHEYLGEQKLLDNNGGRRRQLAGRSVMRSRGAGIAIIAQGNEGFGAPSRMRTDLGRPRASAIIANLRESARDGKNGSHRIGVSVDALRRGYGANLSGAT
jgi:hypothetical protein